MVGKIWQFQGAGRLFRSSAAGDQVIHGPAIHAGINAHEAANSSKSVDESIPMTVLRFSSTFAAPSQAKAESALSSRSRA